MQVVLDYAARPGANIRRVFADPGNTTLALVSKLMLSPIALSRPDLWRIGLVERSPGVSYPIFGAINHRLGSSA